MDPGVSNIQVNTNVKVHIKGWLFGFAVAGLISLPAGTPAQRKQGRSVQGGSGRSARIAARVEPLRTMRGLMSGNVIAARRSDDSPGFNYTITGARISEGRLELQGALTPASRNIGPASAVTATLVGMLAKFRPPEPGTQAVTQTTSPAIAAATGQNPVQQPGREPTSPENAAQLGQLSQATQTTARTAQPPTAPGGKQPSDKNLTEQITQAPVQTRALATAGGGTTGCELMFLKMQLPMQLAASTRAGSQPVQLGVVLATIDNERGMEINQHICRIVRALNSGGKDREIETELTQLNRLLSGGR